MTEEQAKLQQGQPFHELCLGAVLLQKVLRKPTCLPFHAVCIKIHKYTQQCLEFKKYTRMSQ